MFLFAFYSHLTFLCHVNKSKAYHKPDKSKPKLIQIQIMTQKNIKTGKTLGVKTGKTPAKKITAEAVREIVRDEMTKFFNVSAAEINEKVTQSLLVAINDPTLFLEPTVLP